MVLPRFAIELKRESGHELGGAFWKINKPDPKVVLYKSHRLIRIMHSHRLNFVQDVSDHYGVSWPIIDVCEERIPCARVSDVVTTARLTIVRSINRVAVFTHPSSHGCENLIRFERDTSIARWANVE